MLFYLFSFQTRQVREKMERASGVINKQHKPNNRGKWVHPPTSLTKLVTQGDHDKLNCTSEDKKHTCTQEWHIPTHLSNLHTQKKKSGWLFTHGN